MEKLKTSDCMKVFNNDWDHLLADEFKGILFKFAKLS